MSTPNLRRACSTLALLVVASVLSLLPLAPADAADGPGRWEKAQVGLTYTVYRPSTTVGLARTGFQLMSCAPGRDDMVIARYGRDTSKRSISIQESQRGCVDGPDGVGPAGTFTVRGAKATVLGSCGPNRGTCPSSTPAGVRRSAYTTVTLPSGGAGLGSTFVELYTEGLSLAEITTVVRGLVPAG